MKLAFADPRNMTISPLNMHYGRPAPDIEDILPSIRQRGVLLTMLVLPRLCGGEIVPDHYEIIAGRRRWCAAMQVIAEGGEIDPVPVGVLEAGDNAAAIEASLIENLARLPADEVTCWETFAKLIKEGRSPEQIAATFGQSDAVVRRTLALGNLLPRLRTLYRREAIDVATIRALTLASKSQQKAWLAMFDDPAQSAPIGARVKAWLFGGALIPTRYALFSLDDYPGVIAPDLFGEDSYFTDPAAFWAAQNQAIAQRREALLAEGWSGVEVLEAGAMFETWKHEPVGKDHGGKVFIAVSGRGEVTLHKGYLTNREARRAKAAGAGAAGKGEAAPAAERSEVSHAAQTYIDLHRHAAVRAVLTERPDVALRLLLAHAVAGSSLWRIEADPRRAGSQAIAASLEASPAETAFLARRAEAAARLGLCADQPLAGRRVEGGAAGLFAKLLGLPDADVLALAAVVIGESLAAGGAEVEAAGLVLKVDVGRFWTPDEAFFDLIRDREALNAMLREVGGKKVADGNVSEKVKTQKAILRDVVEGSGGRPKAAKWTPRWLAFPAQAYTKRPFKTAARDKALEPLLRAGGRADAAAHAAALTAE